MDNQTKNKIFPCRTENIFEKKTVAEDIAPIGLMRLGLEKEGWSVAFANDIAIDKYEMYRAHFGEEGKHFILGDIHDLNVDGLPTVTLATASFPCNDLSH